MFLFINSILIFGLLDELLKILILRYFRNTNEMNTKLKMIIYSISFIFGYSTSQNITILSKFYFFYSEVQSLQVGIYLFIEIFLLNTPIQILTMIIISFKFSSQHFDCRECKISQILIEPFLIKSFFEFSIRISRDILDIKWIGYLVCFIIILFAIFRIQKLFSILKISKKILTI
jgi:RsiW-degrading membrane proteinase PrsW (M82 family)